jgi:hypothetical protein
MKHLPTGPSSASAGEAQVSYFACEPETRRIGVHLSLEVMDRIGMLVIEAFKSIPRRGLEIGGLLLGSKRSEGDRMIVVVDDFEPLPSEHRQGPSLLLSERDLDLLEQRLAEKRPAVVGFYRSHTRSDVLALAPEDAELMARHFPGAADILLLIRPASGVPGIAAIALRETGRDPELLCGEFPFERGQLIADGYRMVQAAQPQRGAAAEVMHGPPPSSAPPVLPAARAAAPASRREPAMAAMRTVYRKLQRVPHISRWLWAPVAALGLVAWALFLWPEPRPAAQPAPARAPSARAPSAANLALRVVRDGDALRLEWDRNSRDLRGASGVLHIADGERQSRWSLDSRQLSEGSVLYWPKGSDVNFRLEISRQGQTASESVRAIGVGQPASPSRPAPALPQRPEAPVARRLPPRGAEPQQPAPFTAAREHSPAPQPERREPPAPRPSPFAASPQQRAATVPPPVSEPAPPVSTAEPESEAPPAPEPEPAARPAGEPFVSATAEPDRGSRVGRAFSRIPLLGRLRRERPEVIPPRVVRRVLPSVPDRLRRSLRQPLAVEVRAYVSATGNVEYAELLSDGTGRRRQFASLAVYAARQWQFVPAREGERAVPDEMILRFRFGNNESGLRAGR